MRKITISVVAFENLHGKKIDSIQLFYKEKENLGWMWFLNYEENEKIWLNRVVLWKLIS